MLTGEDKKWIKEAIVEGVTGVVKREIEPALDDIRGRIVGVETKTEGLEMKIGKVETRMEGLEREVGSLKIRIKSLPTKMEMENGFEKLERKLDKVTDHQAEVLDDHEGRIEKLELASV